MLSLRSTVAAGAALGAYSFYEARRYRLVARDVPIHAPISELRVLHVSDMHLGPANTKLRTFLAGLPDAMGTMPDLVVATGDLIEGDGGIDPAIHALSRLDARLGRFYVLGSHDYYQSEGPAYSKYFTGRTPETPSKRAATHELEAGLQSKGWISLSNATHHVEVPTGRVRVAGVDDPYLNRHETGHIRRDHGDVLALGLMHAPDVVSEWALHRFDVVFAGHTHGGQVRLPAIGAVVTNCRVPTGLASGLNRVGATWLHVSPGLGTSRWAPIRFFCPPEVTLLRLVPRDAN